MNDIERTKLEKWIREHPGVCPCESELDNPGPDHFAFCPFSDPDYCPEMPGPDLIRDVMLKAIAAGKTKRRRKVKR